jgi:hypothetical protein
MNQKIIDEIQEGFDVNTNMLNLSGIKFLYVFQCIKCGKFFDTVKEIMNHTDCNKCQDTKHT